MLSNAQLSDLFFNHAHPNYDGLFGFDAAPTAHEIGAAIRADAEQFANDYPQLGKDATWYKDDFMKRL